MNAKVLELKALDWELLPSLIALEQEAFGEGGLNRFLLPPFISYGLVFALFVEEKPVGIAEFMRDFHKEKEAYLFGFSIQKEYRGLGLGKVLLAFCLTRLKALGLEAVTLTVSEENKAGYNLYRGFGFSPVGFQGAQYGKGEDRVLLRLDLSLYP